MRVAHIEAGRHLYGGARQVLYLIDGLREAGVENVLLCARGSEIAQAARGLCEVVELPLRGDLDVAAVRRTRKVLRAVTPDIVHVHSRRGADLFGGLASVGATWRAVLTRRVDHREWPPWARLKYRPYHAVIAISRAVEAELIDRVGLPAARVHRVPSGVPSGMHRVPSGMHRVQGGERCVPSGEHRLPSSEHCVPSGEHRLPSSEHRVPSGEHRLPSNEHCVPSGEHRVPNGTHGAPGATHRLPSAEPSRTPMTDVMSPSRALAPMLGLPPGARIAGVVAQLIPRKGHGVLLRALPPVLERYPRWHVVFFGRGPLEVQLRSEVRRAGLDGRVHLAGFMPDLRLHLSDLDLLLHPARKEGLGLAVLEAMSAGVPVAASAAGGLVDVIENGINGLLVPPGDTRAWATAAERLMSDDDLRIRLGAAGLARVQQVFSVRGMVFGNLAVYHSVLGVPAKSRTLS